VGFVADSVGVTGFSPSTVLFLCHNHSISVPYSFNYLSLTPYRVNEKCTAEHPEGNLHHNTRKNLHEHLPSESRFQSYRLLKIKENVQNCTSEQRSPD
jgi:hypothetical protein